MVFPMTRTVTAAAFGLLLGATAAHAEPEGHSFMLYFEQNDAKVNVDAVNVIAAAATSAGELKLTHIVIIGHADTAEPSPDALSKRRAEAVRDALAKDKHLPAGAQITIRAAGSRDLPVATGPGVSEPLNEAVEISMN